MKTMTRLFLAAFFAASFAVGSVAIAQDSPSKGAATGGGEDGVTYKAKTVYDFEDDLVEGDLQAPDGELINSIGNVKHDSLIEIRRDFIPEMLKSLEDI